MKVYLKWCTLCFFSSYLVWQCGLHFAQYCIVQCYMCLIVRTHIIAIKETVWRYTLNCALFVFFELSCMVKVGLHFAQYFIVQCYICLIQSGTHIIAIKETVWRYTLNCTLFCFFSGYLVWQGGLHFAQYCIVQCYMCLIVRTHYSY